MVRDIDPLTRWASRSMVRAVSLFSGAGGFCEGARLAGWEVLCSVEDDDDACRTYAANFPEVPLFKGDIGRFLIAKQSGVPDAEELRGKGVDVVYGGPPCQGFSQIGPRDLDDPRNALYKQFVRIVRRLQPKLFVMENVPNMITMKGGHFKNEVLKAFRSAGYARATIQAVMASDFGVPQHRRRIFWFGVRDDLGGIADLDQTVQAWLALPLDRKNRWTKFSIRSIFRNGRTKPDQAHVSNS
jgi:DNA (cytosine-5)-methyltransferase 1